MVNGLQSATPDEQIQRAAKTLPYNMSVIAGQIDGIRVLLQEDAERPEGQKQIAASTMMALAYAVKNWGSPWSAIGQDMQAIIPLVPETPAEEEGGEEEEQG